MWRGVLIMWCVRCSVCFVMACVRVGDMLSDVLQCALLVWCLVCVGHACAVLRCVGGVVY